MAEKMLITQALDERDLVLKKINDKIEAFRPVDVAKHNETTVLNDRIDREEFAKRAESAMQQITDLIKRYERLDAAIINSNANTWIETSYGRYSVASAIALRERLRGKSRRTKNLNPLGIGMDQGGKDADSDFEQKLADKLQKEYNNSTVLLEAKNQKLQATAEEMRLSILGKDSRNKDDKPLEVVEAYVKENTTELVDPLDIRKKIAELTEKKDQLLRELETAIKVSNATTLLEI